MPSKQFEIKIDGLVSKVAFFIFQGKLDPSLRDLEHYLAIMIRIGDMAQSKLVKMVRDIDS